MSATDIPKWIQVISYQFSSKLNHLFERKDVKSLIYFHINKIFTLIIFICVACCAWMCPRNSHTCPWTPELLRTTKWFAPKVRFYNKQTFFVILAVITVRLFLMICIQVNIIIYTSVSLGKSIYSPVVRSISCHIEGVAFEFSGAHQCLSKLCAY